MISKALFQAHIDQISKETELALAHSKAQGNPFDSIIFHAGSVDYYHADDHDVHFHTVPHFVRFAPIKGADHLLHFQAGKTPVLYHVVPSGFWFELPETLEHPYESVLDVKVVATVEEAIEQIGTLSHAAYIGNDPKVGKALGIEAIEPPTLLHALDWYRAYKTPYEIACIQEAVRIAGKGYEVVRELMKQKVSERKLHRAYLEATGQLERDNPYGTISGWDSNAAILHYQSKSVEAPKIGHTFLMDAGATCFGYASDITRTYLKENPHPIFVEIHQRIDTLTQRLSDACVAGGSFVELHIQAHQEVASILSETGMININSDEAFERDITSTFFPHGLGHHLGIQVHDIGGKQQNISGEQLPPHEKYPFLRTTRPMETGQVLTVEPGFYFIPLLLNKLRKSEASAVMNWNLIDALTPLGGVRVEDDVLVQEGKAINMSRDLIPQP